MFRKCRRLAGKKSKNQRRGQRVEVLTCKCGGIIKMQSVFKGTVKHFAKCTGDCARTARKPRDLMFSPAIRRAMA